MLAANTIQIFRKKQINQLQENLQTEDRRTDGQIQKPWTISATASGHTINL